MPKNLAAARRYIIIDECLSNRFHTTSGTGDGYSRITGKWTITELAEKIAERLDLHEPPSERTIKEDIHVMRNGELGYEAPIKNMRGIGYYYDDPEFSITKNPLSELDVENLKEVLAILKQFRGFKYFTDVNSIISKIEDTVNISEYNRVLFDTIPDAAGLDFIEPLSKAIRKRNIIIMKYLPFDKTEILQLKVHPYLLKEYNNRWFLLAWSVQDNNTWVYGLDRIKYISISKEYYEYAETEDLSNYFKHIVGVSRPAPYKIEQIIVRVVKHRANYLITKPLHSSQAVIDENKEFTTFRYDLIINQELKAKLLEFGKDACVVSPAHLRDEMIQIISCMRKNYECKD